MKKIPKIKLQLTNDGQFDSSKIKNNTVLFFYPKALTGGCSVEVADFQKHLSKFNKIGFDVIGASKDPVENESIIEKVMGDKLLETSNGHDGTWIAHPGLSDIANNVFSNAFDVGKTNQLHVMREDDEITQADLITPCEGDFTEACFRSNIRVSLRYIEAWLKGVGCVPIYGLMEDAATAEISRSSLWQWVKHGVTMDTGIVATKTSFEKMLDEEYNVVEEELGQSSLDSDKLVEAKKLLKKLVISAELTDFLTLPAYRSI